MVVLNKAVGEEGLRSILQLIATRASVDETVLLSKLGSDFKVDPNTGEISINFPASLARDVGTFYIDERGHLMWKNEETDEDIDWGFFYIDDRGHLIWKRNTDGEGDDRYIVVNASNTVEFASDEEINSIIDNIDLG